MEWAASMMMEVAWHSTSGLFHPNFLDTREINCSLTPHDNSKNIRLESIHKLTLKEPPGILESPEYLPRISRDIREAARCHKGSKAKSSKIVQKKFKCIRTRMFLNKCETNVKQCSRYNKSIRIWKRSCSKQKIQCSHTAKKQTNKTNKQNKVLSSAKNDPKENLKEKKKPGKLHFGHATVVCHFACKGIENDVEGGKVVNN